MPTQTTGLILSISVVLSASFLSARAQQSVSDAETLEFDRIYVGTEPFGYFFTDAQWPSEPDGKTVIFVCWENAFPTYAKEAEWVKSAILASWQEHSRIEFRSWRTCSEDNQGIRIAVVTTGPRVKKFGRYLDGEPGGMELNFTFDTWSSPCKETEKEREMCIRSIAVHEFGHALGFAHEQDSPTAARGPGECATLRYTGTQGKLEWLTPYDIASVMNYCNPKYNNLGVLSAGDISSVQQKYEARMK